MVIENRTYWLMKSCIWGVDHWSVCKRDGRTSVGFRILLETTDEAEALAYLKEVRQ